jgi:hypothetical protein
MPATIYNCRFNYKDTEPEGTKTFTQMEQPRNPLIKTDLHNARFLPRAPVRA